jgi:hypothetical protein
VVVDIQLTLRVGKVAGVVSATTSNSGQGEHGVGSDSLGYLRTTGTGYDLHHPSSHNHHLGLERGIKHHRIESVPRGPSRETDCIG